MTARTQSDSIYTDFTKAFDKIDHNALVNKLTSLGIHPDLLRWVNISPFPGTAYVIITPTFGNS